MFFKGKKDGLSSEDKIFKGSDDNIFTNPDELNIVDLDEHKDVDIENLFKASTFDTSYPDKIIIRDLDIDKRPAWADIASVDDSVKPKKKIRRRVKKVKQNPDYIPLASELDDNKVDSDFRKQSADWRDKDYEVDYSGLNDLIGDDSSFLSVFKSAAPLQWVAGALAVIIFVSGILTTSAYAKAECADKRIAAINTLKSYEEAASEEVARVVEDVEAPISAAESEPAVSKILSLVLSSVEKDLKIKLVDEEDTLVKDIDWSVTVTDSAGDASEESDDDMDGIIHMTDIPAGDYSVELNRTSSLDGYEFPTAPQSVSVKAKVEYKVIANIKEEIKTEKEINAAVEDNGNKPADVEQTVASADTVEWLESTKTAQGETYVESSVDITKTSKDTSASKVTAFLDNLKSVFSSSLSKYGTIAYPVIMRADNEPQGNDPSADGDNTNNDNNNPSDPPVDPPTPSHTHNYTYEHNPDGTHTGTCNEAGCTEKTVTETCSGSESAACSKCGYPPQSQPTHTHNYTYKHNSDGTHTGTCDVEGCTEKTVTETCPGNESTACSKCNYKKESTPVEHKITYTPGGDGTHKAVCSVSGCDQNHNQTKATCTYASGSNTCTYCKAAKPAGTYTLTVTGGSGSGKYKEGDSVSVTAAVPSGQKFSSWSASGVTLTDAWKKAASFSFKMPAADVSLAAVFAIEEKYADNAQLYDSDMNPLYVYEDGSYRLAKYSDYKKDKNQKFYKKVEDFLYTGWQTINGKRYYYNRDNKPVTGDQIIGGVSYHFGTDGALSMGSGKLGIDVSKYQPSINWASVKRSGIDYVIIRCGYRGSSTGVLVEDPYFKSHIKGAKAAGLKVGVYFFTTAVTEAEAVEEASMVAYLCGNYGIDYPVFMDCESSPRPGYNNMGAAQRTAIIKAFCNTIRSAGYTPGVYANKTWLTSYINAGELSGYKIWLAQYNSNGPTYGGRYDLWQYTSKGSVDGIPGNVDMNQSYLGY